VFDFEASLKLIVTFAVGAFTLIMTGIGIKVLFFRRPALPGPVEDDRVTQLEARLAELEERVDFAERMLRKP
jgi:hypothetical protein